MTVGQPLFDTDTSTLIIMPQPRSDVSGRFDHLVDDLGSPLIGGDVFRHGVPARGASARIWTTDFTPLLELQPRRFAYPAPIELVYDRHREEQAQAILARIDDLRADAAEEAEMFEEQSAVHLMAFCHDLAPRVCPAIFRLEPGTLRAVWEDEASGEQIGLQFLANGLVQYVLLRPGKSSLLKTLGLDTPRVVRQLAGLLSLDHLWSRG